MLISNINATYIRPIVHSLYTCMYIWVICDLIYLRSIDKDSYSNTSDIAKLMRKTVCLA